VRIGVILVYDVLHNILHYTDDVDLNGKLRAWERFYNYDRPHSTFNGKTPYEALKNTLTKVT
jgi:transposase InsO family protein